jgi:hypothetical protein
LSLVPRLVTHVTSPLQPCHETFTIRHLDSGEAICLSTPPSRSFGPGMLSSILFISSGADPMRLTQVSNGTSGNGTPTPSASGGGSPSPVVITSNILSTMVSLGPDRQPTTVVASFLTTITQNPQQTGSGNNTNPTNNTSTSPSSSTRPLSTAPNDVTLGGGGPGGAPVPGQTGGGGIYGPDDSYTSSVMGLTANMFLGCLVALVGGGLLVLH